MSAPLTLTPEVQNAEIQRIFELHQKSQFKVGATTAAQRIKKLRKLQKAVMNYRPQIKEALYNDYRKHPSEVDLTDVYPVISEIKDACSNLRSWMRKEYVDTPLAILGSSSHIQYEPKGIVLIISPWNFPINLTLGPLVSAVAAGNTVMIKPSEHTSHASTIMQKIVKEVFAEEEVALVEGGIGTSTALLQLPFNHIFFTGAPSIGKVVMAAAAKNLTSVTLELGGKSPTIVDETASVDMAARRIAWGKYLNNGQVCIAPDYVFVHESKKQAFLEAVKKYIKKYYTEDASKEKSYARIVNNRHFRRVKSYIEDAVSKGAKVEMPVYGFTDINEVIEKINGREKPLALYIYSSKNKNINHILANTRAGGTCINHNAVHFFNGNLPFGGSNNSGIGKGHGHYGFKAFSNARGVLRQNVPNALELLLPPYNGFKQKLIDLTIKYF